MVRIPLFSGRAPPSVPPGHLPHKGGDQPRLLGPKGKRTISPLVGEMSAELTEGGKPTPDCGSCRSSPPQIILDHLRIAADEID
ncbi:hypothetical protein EQW76_06040 [Rhizobium sp. rho-13.1]|nr:hypothetical protein EQW76_06040 [Rhizobium sp. rho-13.1]TQY18225.1 hypothetical protein EQW74_00385 [Rhizobium sp. rho-1.1]